MDNIERVQFEKDIKDIVLKVVPQYLQSGAFMQRKLTDTPTDDNQVVNRRYVTLNGTASQRPLGSVIGQQYFDTSLGNGKPIWWNGTGFVDATGNYV